MQSKNQIGLVNLLIFDTLPGVFTPTGLTKLTFDSPTSSNVFVFPIITFYFPTFIFKQLSSTIAGLIFYFNNGESPPSSVEANEILALITRLFSN